MNRTGKDAADPHRSGSGHPHEAERRAEADRAPLRLVFDAFELDEANARLTRGGQPIPLAPKPFAVLCTLARAPRSLVTKNALLDSVWRHRFVTDSVLKTVISEIRAALQDNPKQPRYIETVSRRGYRFIAAVSAPPTLDGTLPAATSSAAPQSLASFPMIGRSDALGRLRTAWRLAAEGRRQIVWIAGEAGVGKTTLIEHFIAEVGEIHSAHGQCVEQYGTGEAYLPVLEALTALCRRDAAVAELIRTVAPAWLLQLPWLTSASEREALRRELSGSSQARMLREMGELLDRYTENRPLLLVTEDLHWSDSATVQLMDYLARRRSSARLLWLGSFRVTEIIASDHPLRAVRHEVRLHGLSDEIVLDAFSEKEVAEYVAERVPDLAADEGFVRALHGRTEGLPLFVADVLNDVIARGSRSGPIAIPKSLTGIIEHYLRQLDPRERTLLEAASVCGVEFRLATVAQVLESDIASLAESCAELTRGQRWLSDVADAGYAFRHALYREVLYQRIAPATRVVLQRKVAASLERERADGFNVSAAELASHFESGDQPLPALRWYAEAAESALLHFSPRQTMSLTERALALLPLAEEGDARIALEMTLATLQGVAAIQVLGITAIEVKRALERALSLLDHAPHHPLRGLFLNALGFALQMRGELNEAQALAERSEALSRATEDRIAMLCACLVHGLVQHLRGRPRIAREWLEKGLYAAEGLDETTSPALFSADPEVIMLGLLAIELLHLGFVDQGRGRLRAAGERARRLREPGPRLAALWFEALFEVRMANPGRVADVAEQIRALVEEYEMPQGRAAHTWFGGWAQAQLGDPRAGYRHIREGYEEAARLGMRAWASETLGYAAEALALSGDWVAARHELEEAMQCASAIGEREYLPQLLLLDARIADALGEPTRAREAARQAIAEARVQEALWLELMALSALCERADATAEDIAALHHVVDRLTEGLETEPVARARSLLKAVGRA
ncbi:MAG TPA: AAA family ATPase [Steroidobacteraceae bacterium]|nr:AAA family ATPase [Steroidobacteraceae bacterium]